MKDKTVWFSGIPELPGLYWLDPQFYGLGPYILQISGKGSKPYIHGHGGGGPLHFFCTPLIMKTMRWANIELPKKWTPLTSKAYKCKTSWLKSKEGYIGIGFMSQDGHGIEGAITWLNDPVNASGSGIHISFDQGYLFSPLNEPSIKINVKKRSKKSINRK